MITNTAKCPQCGARPRDPAQTSCDFCGFGLPRESPVIVTNPSTTGVESRLRAVEASAAFQSLSNHIPGSSKSLGSIVMPLLFLVPWILIGGLVTAGFYAFHPLAALFPGSILAFGVIGILRQVARPFAVSSAPLERVAALVLDKRTEISGGEHATTAYYVTLVGASGDRKEFSADGRIYGSLTQGDAGVAFARADELLEFRRIEV